MLFDRRLAALFAFGAIGPAFANDALEADQPIALVQSDQAHALRVATLNGDFADRRAHQRAAGADEHDLVIGLHEQRADHLAVALADLQRDDTLAAPAVNREVLDRGALAIAVLRRRQHHALLVDDDQRDHFLAHRQPGATHARRPRGA